jgi:hypothetical protein
MTDWSADVTRLPKHTIRRPGSNCRHRRLRELGADLAALRAIISVTKLRQQAKP